MNLFKEMCSFSGWNLFGGIADVGYKQGTNIILNIFCGVTLNAAMGITNQIRAAVYTFVSNLQTAANPQIIKLYASKDILSFHNLICSISKYSVYLMLFLSIPLILNMELILNLWLKNPPEYSVVFSQLILVFCILDSLSGPLWTAMQATGQIRSFMMVTSLCLLLILKLTSQENHFHYFCYINSSTINCSLKKIFYLLFTISKYFLYALFHNSLSNGL